MSDTDKAIVRAWSELTAAGATVTANTIAARTGIPAPLVRDRLIDLYADRQIPLAVAS